VHQRDIIVNAEITLTQDTQHPGAASLQPALMAYHTSVACPPDYSRGGCVTMHQTAGSGSTAGIKQLTHVG